MEMRFLITLVALLGAAEAHADTLTFNLINESGKAITSVIATAAGTTTPLTLASAIAVGGTAVAALVRNTDNCIYSIAIKKSDNTTVDMPETDLCQTSGIGIE
jgi:hypothetical protein